MKAPVVKITSDGPISNKACVTINGEIIPFTEATLRFKPGNFITLSLETCADLVDVEVLEEFTRVIIEKE